MNHARVAEKIDGLIRFFLYVLIFWLPYSSAVIESCVIISLILWFVKRGILYSSSRKPIGSLKDKIYGALAAFKPEPTFLNKPIAFFLLACILSVTASAFFAQSLHNFLTKTVEWFIVYFLVVETFKDKKHIYIAMGIFLFTAFSTALDSIIQFYLTNKDIFNGRVIEPGSRATAGFKTSNCLGGYMALVIPGLLAWMLLGKQKLYQRLIGFVALFFMLWSLAISFSRGAYVGTFLGGMFLLFFISFPQRRRFIYGALGLLLVTVVLLIAFVMILSNSFGKDLISRYETIPWRLDLWLGCIDMVKDKPLFGHGINTFMRVFDAYRGNYFMAPTYAHNCYIQMTAEIGLIGLMGFIWIIVGIFHRSLKAALNGIRENKNLAAMAVGLLSGIFAFLAHSFFDTNFYSLQLSVYLWYMVGVLVAICRIMGEGPLQENEFNGGEK